MEDVTFLQSSIMPTLKYKHSLGLEKLKSYLRDKFFPSNIRYKIWILTLPDPIRITSDFYTHLLKVVTPIKSSIPNLTYIQKLLHTHTKKIASLSKAPTLLLDCLDIILVFQQHRPDILFRDGMQRLITFFYHHCNHRPWAAYKLFTNILLNSHFLKSFYKGRQKKVTQVCQIFEALMSGFKKTQKKIYKVYLANDLLLKNFFFFVVSNLFLDVFEWSIVEKL
jgi:hypothetical protein